MSPVLLIVFNRPDKVSKMLGQLRKVKPKKLFVFADGARTSNEKDSQLCNEVRTLIKVGIDWDCNLQLNFSNTNLGCGLGPVTAIDWFFSKVESGIILEDDCFPDESFFPFCEELLEFYKGDSRIMEIRSNCHMKVNLDMNYSFSFTRISGTWGWATWRRAWAKFDFDMQLFSIFKSSRIIYNIIPDTFMANKLLDKYESGYNKNIDGVWDCQWQFTLISNGGLTIMPHFHLVKNIGYGDDATHCFVKDEEYEKKELESVQFPLKYPSFVIPNYESDIEEFWLNNRLPELTFRDKLSKIVPSIVKTFIRKLLKND